ncbi:adenosylcobinamide-phosphate synthase CbiB [Fundicoccus culcitae]|uniref:Cobalamin biosynthesis protein CobD n=1 Tax=Fundicoccus culcitae TaxID=2969821 RepID=A0ABY5P4P2_9LACT|nr:adenosylcobinamide-phosphate synthase CbiB [Fundicoccus culcitae]UUX33345.1 adenosylcobinamide-phosphate synthase CbiB [Fundicoccus culcitae]
MKLVISIGAAYLLDFLFADPYSWPHPVKLMGKYISWFLKRYNTPSKSIFLQYMIGLLLNVSLIFLIIILSLICLIIAYQMNYYVGWAIEIYMIYTCFSAKGLAIEAEKVKDELTQGGVVKGRKQVAMIVGRNTENLTEEEIIKAVIETVAENTSDGFVAPLFYIVLLGPIGGMIYKAINTLDSMVGYKQFPYKYIGFFSAKFDDLVNWIPARLSWIYLVIASFLLRMNWKNGIRIGLRDRKNHNSPNSAFPESVVAGALDIQLGGTHEYHGKEVYKPTIGDDNRSPSIKDIDKVNLLLFCTSILSVVTMSIILLTIRI